VPVQIAELQKEQGNKFMEILETVDFAKEDEMQGIQDEGSVRDPEQTADWIRGNNPL
jgi:hypothetical protein